MDDKVGKSYPKGKFSYAGEQICERSFMDTLVKYFGSWVEWTGFCIEHNVPFFFETKSTLFGDRVEDSASVNYLPLKSVRDRRVI